MKIKEFLYNVITKENSGTWNLSSEWWASHPEWNYYIRTNVRYYLNEYIWLGGGGATEEEAYAMACRSVQANYGAAVTLSRDMVVFGPLQVKGTLTTEVIKNR